MTWWWLSFSDGDGPRGVAIVEGDNILDAAEVAWQEGCNPGGEVLGIRQSDDDEGIAERERLGVYQLITPERLAELGYTRKSAHDYAEEHGVDIDMEHACEGCQKEADDASRRSH